MAHSGRVLGWLSVVVIVVGLAGGIYWRLRDAPPEDSESDEPIEHAEVVASVRDQFNTEIAVPVSGTAVVLDTLWLWVAAQGRAEAIREVRLIARVSGVVASVPVQENQTVRGNQLLVQIDTAEYALDVATTAAALLKAEADYQARVLFDEELEDEEVRARRNIRARAVTGLDQAEVEHRRAKMKLEHAAVRSPFRGLVADLEAVPGQFVREGDQLLTLVEVDPVKVEFQVLGTELDYLEAGRVANVTFTAFPDNPIEARIQTINPIVDPESRTGRVTVHIPNPEGRIRPGMYAEADLQARHFPDRILVPRAAVLERGDRRRSMLFVLEEGRAKWRYVTPGRENADFVELLDGDESWVAPGEIVLVNGHHYLTHDAAVELVDDPEAAGGRPSR